MDTVFAIAVVAVWIAISAVGLIRAYGSGGPSPQKPRLEAGKQQAVPGCGHS
jgi:hypothetical protein